MQATRTTSRFRLAWALLVGALFISLPQVTLACATCMGSPDDPLTKGLNAGIFSLLGMVVFVLSGAAAFAIYLVRKSAEYQRQEESKL